MIYLIADKRKKKEEKNGQNKFMTVCQWLAKIAVLKDRRCETIKSTTKL